MTNKTIRKGINILYKCKPFNLELPIGSGRAIGKIIDVLDYSVIVETPFGNNEVDLDDIIKVLS